MRSYCSSSGTSMLTWFDIPSTRTRRFMLVPAVAVGSDEAHQHLRSCPSVQRGRGFASTPVGRFSRSLERNQLRAPPELRRPRSGRMGHQRVSRAVWRNARCFDGAANRTQEPRSVAVVLRAPTEGQSQRQARILGQRTRRARPSNVHPQHIVLSRVGRILPSRTPRRQRPEREVWIRGARTAPSRSSGGPELERVRQARSARTVLRRDRTDVQGLSASHHRRFSTGATTGFGRSRLGHRCEQPRRLYDHDRPTVPVRRARPVRPLPRNHAAYCGPSVETPRGSVLLETNTVTVPPPDAPTRPRPRRALSGLGRTVVRRGCCDGVRWGPHGRSRNIVVGTDERKDAQLLGVSGVHQPSRVYGRGVRHHGRSPLGSVDESRVSELWFDRANHAAPRLADVCVRVRRPRGLSSERDVPETAQRCSTADGTARAVHVGQSAVAFDHRRPAKSQRTAHEPASCLRGTGIAETPSVRKPRRSGRGGCHCML
jgi:hypothetical protein